MLCSIWTQWSFVFLLIVISRVESKAIRKCSTANGLKTSPHPLNDSNTLTPASISFSTPASKKYAVPRRLPLADFSIGQTYAGLLDVSENSKETDQLFFWFVPTNNPVGTRDVALWTNGGPGCSSLFGALSEIGPVLWDSKKKALVANQNSWSNHAHMIFLEHPANTGFSRGNIVIENEDQVARYILTFLIRFLDVFPELRGSNLFLTGESYAGMYVSYTAELIYREQYKLALKLQGTLMVDPLISIEPLQVDTAVLGMVNKYNSFFKLNSSVIGEIEKLDNYCQASRYLTENLKFPPAPFPDSGKIEYDRACSSIWSKWATALPHGFDIYNIGKGEGTEDVLNSSQAYFRRSDVRSAFHVQESAPWVACSSARNIFPRGDSSIDAFSGPLPEVIQKNKRTIIIHGEWDGRLPIQGTILAIQSSSWGGKQGFQQPINRKFIVDGKEKGTYQSERGFTFLEVFKAGHMVPHDQPEAALSAFLWFLGRRQNL